MDGGSISDMAVNTFDPKRVAVLAGPTSAGKTCLALQLCKRLPMQPVCMDSMQVYKELSYGVSSPTNEELATVPHHLYGVGSITKPMTTARFESIARQKIIELQQKGIIPLFSCGTGLYLRALFEGLDDLPATPPELRGRLEAIAEHKGRDFLYRMLQRLDPRGAARLHPNDRQRTQRFLEVRILGGMSILDAWGAKAPPTEYPVVAGLEVPRQLLVRRIEATVAKNLENGWIDEVRALMEADLIDLVLEIRPLGYRSVTEYLAGKLSYEKMVEVIAIETRQFAKRQMTWFRKVSYIQWFPFDPDSGYNIPAITEFMEDRLG